MRDLVLQVWLECKDLVGRRLADVKAALRDAWATAARHSPAVVVLDNLHVLCPKAAEGPHAGSPADLQAWLIADVIDELVTSQRRAAADARRAALAWSAMSADAAAGSAGECEAVVVWCGSVAL
jgi:hypothetical protein